jgi:hypothetical protein
VDPPGCEHDNAAELNRTGLTWSSCPSWRTRIRGSGNSRRSSRRCGSGGSGGPAGPRSCVRPGRSGPRRNSSDRPIARVHPHPDGRLGQRPRPGRSPRMWWRIAQLHPISEASRPLVPPIGLFAAARRLPRPLPIVVLTVPLRVTSWSDFLLKVREVISIPVPNGL